MWSKGFSGSPFSPAGEVQRYGAFFDGLARGNGRSRKAIAVAVGVVVLLVLVFFVAWGISSLVQ